ncbi:WXG100 family type VII secretion target [Micromonospora profundi]|uniref:WXG100 family type VII secretion target n=1 Tax=Micromonospora profundi TaxID=1420889 RepID=UPI00364FFC3D
MAPRNISTTEEGMRAAAQEFAAKASEFSSANQNVDGQVDILMTSWTGQAAMGFQSAMDSWGQSFNEVIRALQEMQAQMEATLAGYSRGEDEASTYTSSLNSALPGF